MACFNESACHNNNLRGSLLNISSELFSSREARQLPFSNAVMLSACNTAQ